MRLRCIIRFHLQATLKLKKRHDCAKKYFLYAKKTMIKAKTLINYQRVLRGGSWVDNSSFCLQPIVVLKSHFLTWVTLVFALSAILLRKLFSLTSYFLLFEQALNKYDKQGEGSSSPNH